MSFTLLIITHIIRVDMRVVIAEDDLGCLHTEEEYLKGFLLLEVVDWF